MTRVAALQASGPFLDRDGCLDQAIGWIEQAGAQGVELLAFPEGFIPGHPLWYHFHPVTSVKSLSWAARLFDNSLVVGERETDALAAAARRAGTHVVIGICEKRAGTTGTMYNSQLFIDAEGGVLGCRRKLMPTVGERIVHAPGTGELFPAFRTPAGTITGLICGENANPLASVAIAAGGTQVHVASWPSHFSPNEHPMSQAIAFNTLALSYQASCFVLNACGVVTPEMQDLLAVTEDDRRFLEDPANGGGASIVGAKSRLLAGPLLGDRQELLVADIDLGECVEAKVVHDYAGHYNRPDVFTLIVRPGAEGLVVEGPSEAPTAVGDESLPAAPLEGS